MYEFNRVGAANKNLNNLEFEPKVKFSENLLNAITQEEVHVGF